MRVLPRILGPLWIPATLLLAWETSARLRWIDPLFFPAPSSLSRYALQLILSGELASHLRATLSRLAVGFSLGASAGLVLGILMGALPPVRRSFEWIVSAGYSTPKVTLLPMLMLFFGIGSAPGILVVAAACFIQMTIHTMDGVRGVNRRYVEMASNYGARPFAVFRDIYLPSSLPQVFTGLRLALGISLVLTISVELVSSRTGLGSMLWLSWQTFNIDKVYIGVATSALLGAACHLLLRWLERRVIRWRPQA
jgi:NitT/TauT family transport system permease protein